MVGCEVDGLHQLMVGCEDDGPRWVVLDCFLGASAAGLRQLKGPLWAVLGYSCSIMCWAVFGRRVALAQGTSRSGKGIGAENRPWLKREGLPGKGPEHLHAMAPRQFRRCTSFCVLILFLGQ